MVSKIVGVALIALGVLGLLYGGFSYTKETHDAELGPLKFEMKERERVHVPLWLSVTAVVAGTGLILLPRRRS